MLSSLFGELGGALVGPKKPDAAAGDGEAAFQATTLAPATGVDADTPGPSSDRLQHDLVVSGSPAQAIRDHFATTRADLDTADRLITLLDPVGAWGSAVVKALSDAGGRPIERLHLREQTTLRTLATIERTTLLRRQDDMLRIYHADVRAPGPGNAEIPVALMERSHLTAVIVGAMQPHAVDAMLQALRAATVSSNWRCPHLLFMLQPGAAALHQRIRSLSWPGGLHIHLLNDVLGSTSSVWNALLGTWNQVKNQSNWDPSQPGSLSGPELPAPPPAAVLEPPLPDAPMTSAPAPAPPGGRKPLDPVLARSLLADLLLIDGLAGGAIVDGQTGLVVASEVRDATAIDIHLWGAASAQVLRAHRMAVRSVGLPDRVDEVMSSTGSRQQVLRALTRHPDLFLMALLEKRRANLSLARFKLMEIEKQLS